MKFVIVVFLFGFAELTLAQSKPYYDLRDAEKLFEKFQKDYNRHYKDERDRQIHFEEFKKSLIRINKYNAEAANTIFGINDFADRTSEEREQHMGFLMPKHWV